MPISFTKSLRDPIRRGEVTVSVRYWWRPRTKVGERSRMEDGWVTVTGLRQIDESELTDDLARRSGFPDLPSMLKVAQHGASDLIWLVEFEYEPDFPI